MGDRMHLPLAVQEFREMRQGGFYYVDKTDYIQLLVEDRLKFAILSRPRRFGKSLFIDTLKEAFSGSEELFRGLAMHDKWDWSIKHPVIHLTFSGGNFRLKNELADSMDEQLGAIEENAGVTTSARRPAFRLKQLIRKLHSQSGQKVVVLVDEYDRPILDSLEAPEIARHNRDELGGIYGVLKDISGKVRFCFFSGVGRFAKTSLYSGMNQFTDISLYSKYSAICGYTEFDLDNVFDVEFGDLDRDSIREWYNGYCWLGEDKIYNPYDILNLLSTREFEPWWFSTGSPEFMIDTLKRNEVMSVDLAKKHLGIKFLHSFDIDRIDPEVLLFQTGYLTISEKVDDNGVTLYGLDYPNREVRQYLNVLLLDILAPGASDDLEDKREDITGMLEACDDKKMEKLFQTVFAGIPRQWHSRVDLIRYEAYVASVFYSYFMGAGLIARAEESTSRGRLDLSVTSPSCVYLFEFKMVENAATGEALNQIQEMDYVQLYRGKGRSVYLVGVEFSRSRREIVGFDLVEDTGTSKPQTD